MRALLKNYRQAPRKVRLLADLVRGKDAAKALTALAFTDKRAAAPVAKLIKSALANAEHKGVSTDNLIVSDIRVDKGVVMKRWMPKAFGRATPINKRTSNLVVVLGERKEVKGQKSPKQSALATGQAKVKSS